jgi:hypothetical protein
MWGSTCRRQVKQHGLVLLCWLGCDDGSVFRVSITDGVGDDVQALPVAKGQLWIW